MAFIYKKLQLKVNFSFLSTEFTVM